jgi:hypothetical protein
MARKQLWKIIAVIGASVLLMLAAVLSIRRFGSSNTQAFAGIMSFLAVVVAALATILYVQETADIARATRETAREQARVARLMEQDLRLRVQPHLRYEPKSSPQSNPSAYVRNVGSGMAVDIKASVRFDPGGREVPLYVPQMLEPRDDHVETVSFKLEAGETSYIVVLKCTDSLGLCDYSFEWNSGGKIVKCDLARRSSKATDLP